MGEPATPFISPEELANRPKPKVVDATALPNELVSGRKKPSLAELRGNEKKPAAARLTNRTWDAENYTLPGIDLLDEHDLEGRDSGRSGGAGAYSANLD